MPNTSIEELKRELALTKARLEESEATLHAIQSGEVDAVVVKGDNGMQVFTLQDSDYHYRLLFQNMSQGALSLAPNGTILHANKRFASFVDRALSNIIGTHICDHLAPQDAHLADALLLTEPEQTAHFECNLMSATDTHIPVLISATAYTQDDFLNISLIVTDLREQKTMQEHMLQVERLVVLGQLAGGIGHDLRDPLNVISSAVFYLKMSQSNADPKLAEFLDIIENSTKHASNIIANLLDFARAQVIKRTDVDLPAVIQRALDQAPPPPIINIVLDLPPDLPPVFVDPVQLQQVLANLISNAVDAMPDGGTLSLSANAGANSVAVHVKDTGQGILPENRDRIFQPLFTTKAHGVGLGLSLSKILVEGNGGTIEFDSTVENGTEFVITLLTRQG